MGEAREATTTGDGGVAALPHRMHHHAHVVRDQGQTRRSYEGVLGFPLVATWCEVEDVRGKVGGHCHTFYARADGSALAFFQFADQADYDEFNSTKRGTLGHIALAVDAAAHAELDRWLAGDHRPNNDLRVGH